MINVIVPEDKIFKTLVDADNERYGNDYILGRVSGMMLAICRSKTSFGMVETKEGTTLTTECTEDEYREFAELVEKHYPGLCKFNY